MLPFLAFLLMFVLFFADLYQIVNVENDPNDKVYPGVYDSVAHFLDTYRGTVGGNPAPVYSVWLEESVYWKRLVGIVFVWAIWLLASYINQIIVKNFLINYVRFWFAQIVPAQEQFNYM